MTVTGGGRTQTATRAGSQIIANAGGVPGMPTLVKQGGLATALKQLEGAKPNGNKNPDRSAKSSGFSSQNSGQPAAARPTGSPNLANSAVTNSSATPTPRPSRRLGSSSRGLDGHVIATPRNNPVPGPPANPGTNPLPPPLPAPPTGTPRTSQTLTGFAAGVGYGQPGSLSTSPNLLKPGEDLITTEATTGQAKGTIIVSDLQGPTYPSTTTLQAGGTGGRGAANSAFIDDKTYIMVTQYNDLSRLSAWQEGGRTFQVTDTSVVASAGTAPFLSDSVARHARQLCVRVLELGLVGQQSPRSPRQPDHLHRRRSLRRRAHRPRPCRCRRPAARPTRASMAGLWLEQQRHLVLCSARAVTRNGLTGCREQAVFNGTLLTATLYSGTDAGAPRALHELPSRQFHGRWRPGRFIQGWLLRLAELTRPSTRPAPSPSATTSAPYKSSGVFAGQR